METEGRFNSSQRTSRSSWNGCGLYWDTELGVNEWYLGLLWIVEIHSRKLWKSSWSHPGTKTLRNTSCRRLVSGCFLYCVVLGILQGGTVSWAFGDWAGLGVVVVVVGRGRASPEQFGSNCPSGSKMCSEVDLVGVYLFPPKGKLSDDRLQLFGYCTVTALDVVDMEKKKLVKK